MSPYLVITGANRGIGEMTASHFIQNKWSVINISRLPCSIPGVLNIYGDLSTPEALKGLANELDSHLKNASSICLVHNAVFQTGDTVETVTLNDLEHTLNVNLVSSVVLNQMIIPVMKPGSSILYMGSMLADRGVPKNTSYIISKHAVLGLMRSTCQDLMGRDISTCCICPGLVDTDLLRNSMDKDLIDYVLDTHVVGKRLINPMEIAKVLYACATNPVMNGALVPTNLGLVAG